MTHESAINRGLFKCNLLLWPRDPVERSEAYNLGCDARNDFRPIDENPYVRPGNDPADFWGWVHGWQDTDRMLDDDSGD